MESLKECPVCKNSSFSDFLTCEDYVATNERFKLIKCSSCDFVFTSPRPESDKCSKYYESSKYISHQDEDNSLIIKLYRLVRNRNMKWKINTIEKYHTNKGQLLDYGCGLGDFLNYSKQQGWNSVGLDISENARKTVKERYNIDVFPNSDIFKLDEKSKEVISLWHVLEHVYNLDETLNEFKRILKDNGTLFIALPNRQSWDGNHYKNYWDGYDVPRHIYHFTPKDLEVLMKRIGFKIVEKQGMFFDAFYICMRSEMHKGNKLKFILGGIKGMISNIKAYKSNNYSSILYIIKKDI